MKLRILGNSLRLRLSVPEVALLKEDNVISDKINFGRSTLTYKIELTASNELDVSFSDNQITVWVPEKTALNWADTDEVSIRATKELREDSLRILIEKDFACLKPREGENESELFPNPQAG